MDLLQQLHHGYWFILNIVHLVRYLYQRKIRNGKPLVMEKYIAEKQSFNKDGFVIIQPVFSQVEVRAMQNAIDAVTINYPSFRKAKDVFAIRRFLQEIPGIQSLLFTNQLCEIINLFFGSDYFVVKSIYFDKPSESNWFVPFHQDITVSVNKKVDIDGFNNWTVKQNYFAVQPPLTYLQNNFTVRIHLDDTDANNGALKVIPSSHTRGIIRPQTIDRSYVEEKICEVKRGGVMLMRPLLLHASGKTVNNNRRRVIHVEFSNCKLPTRLQWPEYMTY